ERPHFLCVPTPVALFQHPCHVGGYLGVRRFTLQLLLMDAANRGNPHWPVLVKHLGLRGDRHLSFSSLRRVWLRAEGSWLTDEPSTICHQPSAVSRGYRQMGSGFPLVSSAKGRKNSPIANASAVIATGTPRLPYDATPAPTRNTMPHPTNLPTELVKPMALPRHSVVYCSGIHSVYIAKFAPPMPRRNTIMKNNGSACGR